MKRIKKVIAFALMTVMMMAMSMTAFAAESTNVTITNFAESAEGAEVTAYQFARVTDKNTIEIDKWAQDAGYKAEAIAANQTDDPFEMDPDVATALDKAFVATASPVKGTAKVTSGVASFTLPAGAYIFRVADDENTYNAMVVVTIKRDDNGNYVSNPTAQSIKAKSENIPITKVEDEKFTSTDSKVKFEIGATIPYVKENEKVIKKFVLVDQLTAGKYDLNEDGTVTVTITFANGTTEDRNVKVENNGFELNLNDLVEKTENHDKNFRANEKIKFTYYGIATEVKMQNTAWLITPHAQGEPDFKKITIYSYTGTLTVEKTGMNGTNEEALEGAEFVICRKISDTEYEYAILDKNNNNKLTGWTKDEKQATPIVTKKNAQGKAVASAYGFDRASVVNGALVEYAYYFKETKAPENWTINTDIVEAKWNKTVDLTEAQNYADGNGEYFAEAKVVDSQLIRLPFTGGMGTTIFTVLGVAIMAMAAALYFATKKNNVK